MSNSDLKVAIATVKTAINAFNDYRERKAAETYDALSHAAENYTIAELADLGRERIDARKETAVATAGTVAENARIRLEKAREEAAARANDVAKESRKQRKAVVKDLTKQKKQAIKKARKSGLVKQEKKTNKVGLVFGIITVLSALAGALYWYIFRPEKAGTVPPRVEEHAGEGSTLVYSTQTPAETEEDRELLNSLDEQLAQHKAETKAENEVTPIDDSEDTQLDESLDEIAEEIQADFDKKHGK